MVLSLAIADTGWLQNASHTAANLNARITRYDQAASTPPHWQSGEKSFKDKFINGTEQWGLRTLCGEIGNSCYRFPTPGRVTSFGSQLHKYTSATIDYYDILGLKTTAFDVGQNEYFKNYRQFFLTNEGQNAWRQTVHQNFSNLFNLESRPPFSVKSYFKNTLLKRNLRTVTQELSQGNLCSAMLRTFGMGMAVLNIWKNTANAYRYAHSKEDGSIAGRLETVGYTMAHAVGQSIKAAFSWEAGTIGFMVGSALFPVGSVSIGTGIIIGSLIGTTAYKAASYIIPDPPKQSA